MKDYFDTRDNEDYWVFWITYIKVSKINAVVVLQQFSLCAGLLKFPCIAKKNIEGVTFFKTIKAVRIKNKLRACLW